MAQECWEIGRARGGRGTGSLSEIGGACGVGGVTCDTCLNISPLILRRRRAEPTFLSPGDGFNSEKPLMLSRPLGGWVAVSGRGWFSADDKRVSRKTGLD